MTTRSTAAPSRSFQDAILLWFSRHGRDYPWRQTRDPFKVLVAEVLLRLTGADRVAKAYTYLARDYGTPMRMAVADPEDISRVFRVLGLFSRASSLVEIARDVEHRFAGAVPGVYEELISIKGVGPYTANAVLCFAHNRRVPLVDGRISRVLSRHFGCYTDRSPDTDHELWGFAGSLLPPDAYREYNFALLDIGATLCKHTTPLCTGCPLCSTCMHIERTQADGTRTTYSKPVGSEVRTD